ncbi:MAG: preprotein translocase subunit SecY [Bacteroidia bacterium]|nr:preprotein translocase subunit SecY [Bacteroidia bacterium]
MRRLIDTIRNIWKIDELKNRILVTLGFLLVYRLGSYVVLPGVNPQFLEALEQQTSDSGVLGLLDMFSGGAFSNASILGLGIMPYISASIVVQLLGMVIPYFQRLQRDGESGRRKINQMTRVLTVGILLIQAPAYLTNLHYKLPDEAFAMSGLLFNISSTIILTAGTMFVMWLGERITDRGIGNGISLIIMIGIVARLPHALFAEFADKLSSNATGGLVMLLLEFLMLFFVFVGTIMLVQGTRRIPVQYAKRIEGNKQYGGVRQYIPLKVNAAGVMPIIFAQAIMFLPVTLIGLFTPEAATGFAATFSDFTGFWYNFVFALLIIIFTYFYTALIFNPQQMSEEMKRNNGFIPGVRPGKATAEYIDSIMSKITLPGSFFLAIVAILPAFATIANVEHSFAQFYGGTSLLILVGVVLDTLQQIESHLLMRHYDGLMKSGRIMGRSVGAAMH